MHDGPVIHGDISMAPEQCISNSNNPIPSELVSVKETITISIEEYNSLVRCKRYVDKYCKIFKITCGDDNLIYGFVPQSDGRTELVAITKYLQNHFEEELK